MTDLFPDVGDPLGTVAVSVVHGGGGDHTGPSKQGRKLTENLSTSEGLPHGTLYLLASFRDATKRKQREQRLGAHTRMSRHDLRNDGNVIRGHAELHNDGVEDSSPRASATRIQAKVDRRLALSGKVGPIHVDHPQGRRYLRRRNHPPNRRGRGLDGPEHQLYRAGGDRYSGPMAELAMEFARTTVHRP